MTLKAGFVLQKSKLILFSLERKFIFGAVSSLGGVRLVCNKFTKIHQDAEAGCDNYILNLFTFMGQEGEQGCISKKSCIAG